MTVHLNTNFILKCFYRFNIILFIYFFEISITSNNFVNDNNGSYKMPKIVKYHTESDISFLIKLRIVPDAFLKKRFFSKTAVKIAL